MTTKVFDGVHAGKRGDVLKVALKHVLPNPFRQTDRYPILREKIDALKASIDSTTFWDNIVARKAGDKVEIAYGHHRIAALRELYPSTHEVSFILRAIDDGMMLRMLAEENSDAYGTNANVQLETVKAVVEAYGAGRIVLPGVAAKTPANTLRFAPSFRQGHLAAGMREHPYTGQTVSGFLGKNWGVDKVQRLLATLEQQERGLISDADLRGLNVTQAASVTTHVGQLHTLGAQKASKEPDEKKREQIAKETKTEAKNLARELAAKFRLKQATPETATKAVREISGGGRLRPEEPKPVDRHAEALAESLGKVLSTDSLATRAIGILDAVRLDGAEMGPPSRRKVASALRKVAQRAEALAVKFETVQSKRTNGAEPKQLRSGI